MAHEQVSIEHLYDLIKSGKNPFILDVRSEEEFEKVRIESACNLPLAQVTPENVSNIMKEKGYNSLEPIFCLCAVGPRAISACEKLENTFDHIYHVVGCMNAWQEENFPVVKGA